MSEILVVDHSREQVLQAGANLFLTKPLLSEMNQNEISGILSQTAGL